MFKFFFFNSCSNKTLDVSDLPDGKYRIVKNFYLDGAKTVVVGLFNINKQS
ncbi:MAG: hypothetical protein IJ086_13150 [Clostridium sp.]|nr:hypothetical protein [Clostridium sp.]